MKVLHLDSGIFLEQSVSRQVSQNIVNKKIPESKCKTFIETSSFF